MADARSPGTVIAMAIIRLATYRNDEASASRLRELLRWVDAHWPVRKAIVQSTHKFDPRVNSCTANGTAIHLADEFTQGVVSREALECAAFAYGEHLDTELAAPLVFPLIGFNVTWAATSVYVGVLFLAVGLPVGIAAALLLDCTGAGLHRGIAQIFSGLHADAMTVELGPIKGYREKLEALDASRTGETALAGTRGHTMASRASAQPWRTTVDLDSAVCDAISNCALATLPPADVLVLEAGPWQTPRLRQPSPFRISVLGGGLRYHEFDVSHLQALRRFVVVCWLICKLRRELGMNN